MTEEPENNNQNDHPTEEQQPSNEKQQKLSELSEEEKQALKQAHEDLKLREKSEEKLKQILEDHKGWVESDGKVGRRADLSRGNLNKVSLSNANLQKADLSRADMRNTVLDGVKGLSDANLQYANLEGATGLLGNEFAQADVTGTKLPDEIKDFMALEAVKETSQNARKIFFAMLLGCVYSWLTIVTTTDVKLLTNTASSPLPIIGTEIPIAWFYIVAPLVLISLYLYFHFYLQSLWESLAGLPAIFPDGKRLDERAYPWLLNKLVRRNFKRLKDGRTNIAKFQELVTIALAWWVVPLTMLAFWLRYLVRHEFIGTSVHIVLIILMISTLLISYNLCKFILQGNDTKTFKLIDFWHDRKSYLVIIIGFIFILLSNYGFSNWGADFREKDISIKPSDYYKIENAEKQIASVKGANLQRRNLRNANMYDAFLVKADLRYANLQNANLKSADLRNAKLAHANLQNANLKDAKLQNAKLFGTNLQNANLENADLHSANLKDANLQSAELYNAKLKNSNLREADFQDTNLERARLQNANLFGANLQNANLSFADLQNANLSTANLQNADLSTANLQNAVLRDADFQKADLSKAKLQNANLFGVKLQNADLSTANLQNANLSFADLQNANLSTANLQNADLSTANLQNANLSGAKLQNANLSFANLQNANLLNADLTGAKNLKIEQLSKAKTLYKAKLDPELLEQVRKCCPHLLEKPKEEPEQK
jgi:uncharacterized protein YjbI with pentapeptide repeats